MDNASADGVILVISSEVLVRSKISPYLRDCGYTVVEAAGTEEAAAVLESGEVAVDAILCDMHALGGGNIFAFQTWVRATYPHVEVVVGGTVEKVADAAADMCEDATVSPPFDTATLADLIRQSLARRSRNQSEREQREA